MSKKLKNKQINEKGTEPISLQKLEKAMKEVKIKKMVNYIKAEGKSDCYIFLEVHGREAGPTEK